MSSVRARPGTPKETSLKSGVFFFNCENIEKREKPFYNNKNLKNPLSEIDTLAEYFNVISSNLPCESKIDLVEPAHAQQTENEFSSALA